MQGRAIDPPPTPSRCGIRFFQLQAPGGSGEPPLPRAPSSWPTRFVQCKARAIDRNRPPNWPTGPLRPVRWMLTSQIL